MKKVWKRALAMLLVVIMVGGAAPIGALAEMDWPTLPEGAVTSWLNDSIDSVKIAAKWLYNKLHGLTLRASAEKYVGTCGANGDNVTWSLDTDTGVLTISGTGNMENYIAYVTPPPPWYSNKSSIQTVTIDSGVTSIGDEAFSNCSSMTSITIPDTVTSIGIGALNDCGSLLSVAIPDGVTSIGRGAFNLCTGLTSVTIPYGVRIIDSYTFSECTNLMDVTIPDSVTNIGDDAFLACTSLRSVTIPNSVTSIGTYAFTSCTSLRSVTMSNSVTSIGVDAFGYCENLTSVTISNNVETISDGAFKFCTSLENVTIPKSVTKIGRGAFTHCTCLKSVTIPDSGPYIGIEAFSDCTSLVFLHIPSSKINGISYGILENTSAYICSDTDDCYAHTYADVNGIEFRVCTGHGTGTTEGFSAVADSATVISGHSLAFTVTSSTSDTKIRLLDGDYIVREWEYDPAYCTDNGDVRTWHVSQIINTVGENRTLSFQAGDASGYKDERADVTFTCVENPDKLGATTIEFPTANYPYVQDDLVGLKWKVDGVTEENHDAVVNYFNVNVGFDGRIIYHENFIQIKDSYKDGHFYWDIPGSVFHEPGEYEIAVTSIKEGCQASEGTVKITINKTNYSITYDANGGTGAPNSQTKTFNVPLTLSSVQPTREDFTFLGWAESASATSAAYAPGGKFTANKDCTLYAVWQSDSIQLVVLGKEIQNVRVEQTGVYAEIWEMTSALNGGLTWKDTSDHSKGAVIRIHNQNYGYNFFFYFTPTKVGTFNVEVYEDYENKYKEKKDKITKNDLKFSFYTFGVLDDNMIYGNVDGLTRIGNAKLSDNSTDSSIVYLKADKTGLEDYTQKDTSFSIYDSSKKKNIPGSTTLQFRQTWLTNDSIKYNHDLARFCAQMSTIGYGVGYGKDVTIDSKTDVKTALENVGFTLEAIQMNTGRDEVNCFVASRKGIDLKTGKEYVAVLVGTIGSHNKQWDSDFDPYDGVNGSLVDNLYHCGFYHAMSYALKQLTPIMLSLESDIRYKNCDFKIIMTGHSRGAAAANLLAKQLIDNKMYTSERNIFTYAFATPNSALKTAGTGQEKGSDDYQRIYNVVNPEDFVTKVLPSSWNFGRFGQTFVLPSISNESQDAMFNPYYGYLILMEKEYQNIKKDGSYYTPYKEGEVPVYTITATFNSINGLDDYYGATNNTDKNLFNFFTSVICPFVNGSGGSKPLAAIWAAKGSPYYDFVMFFKNYHVDAHSFDEAHEMQTYCAYMLSLKPEDMKYRGGYKGTVNCPVDVEIYEKDTNELVGRIVNNVVDETVAAKENAVAITVNGDSKSFWLPSNGEYTVKLIGNGNGTMDYTISEIDSDTGETGRVNFFDVPITTGKTMTCDFTGEEYEITDSVLHMESGGTLTPTEQLIDEQLDTLTIEVKTEGSGWANSLYNVTRGDYVTLHAYADSEKTAFLGWYENGRLVSEDAEYAFVAKTSRNLTAKFEKSAVDAVPVSIRVSKAPTKTVYTYRKDTSVDLSGMELEVTYSDGSKKTVTDTSAYKVSGYSAKPRGEKTVIVEYEGVKTDFKVTVKYAWWQWLIRIFLLGFIWY